MSKHLCFLCNCILLMILFFLKKKKEKKIVSLGANLLYVMGLQSVLNMCFISLPLIYKRWMTRWYMGRRKKLHTSLSLSLSLPPSLPPPTPLLLNCNIVDIICFFSYPHYLEHFVLCTGSWSGVRERERESVTPFWYIPISCVYHTTASLTILNKFLSLKREKKMLFKKKMFSLAAVNIFAWWNSRLTLSKFYQ